MGYYSKKKSDTDRASTTQRVERGLNNFGPRKHVHVA